MALVTVKSTPARLVAVTSVGIDGRDHAVLGDTAHDHEPPVGVLPQVLADDRRQQHHRLRDGALEVASLKRRQQRVRVLGQSVDQRLARRRVLVIADRLTCRAVIVITPQQRPQLMLQFAVADHEQPADRRTHQRDRVHRGDRVIKRGAIQHPPPTDQPRSPAHLQDDLENPIRALGGGQPGAHVDQHRVHEARIVVVQATRGVLPAQVIGEAVDRLTVGAALHALQHHHGRHDRRRHRPPAHITKQIRKQLVREQAAALTMQQRVDRVLADATRAKRRRRADQPRRRRDPNTHPSSLT